MIISFGWTAPAVEARVKNVTRRAWKDEYAAKFHKGDICQAYTKSPRFQGKRICNIRLTREPYTEPLPLMPLDHYDKEGFEYLHAHQDLISQSGWEKFGDCSMDHFLLWRSTPVVLWVVHFDYIEG